MTNNREEPVGKETLADALLTIDSRMVSSSADGREIAREALRRDRRRVRILTAMTLGFFLLAVIAICLPVYFCYLKVVPAMDRCQQDISALEQQLAKQEPQTSKPDLLIMTARIAAGLGGSLFILQAINLWGISALLAVMLAAAFCTLLLVMATRRATLRQIQVSLLVLSEQFDMLQRSLPSSHSTGGGQAAQGPGA